MPNIILLGPPGAGKGTQSQKLMHKYGLMHIAPGDLLRAEIAQDTPLGRQAAEYIHQGQLAPTPLVIALVEKKLAAYRHGLLLDGFPRTLDQAQALDQACATHHISIDSVVLLTVPEAALLKRLSIRAKELARVDDQDENKIATRMQVYQNETLPVAAYYAQQKKLLKVNGVGPVQTVFERIVAAVDQQLG